MTKKELEAYAALVLIKTAQICEPFSADWLKDKPDLQIGSFGIEVTEVIDKKDGEQRQIDSEILNCETYENANTYINNLKYPRKYRSETKELPGSERDLFLRTVAVITIKSLSLLLLMQSRINLGSFLNTTTTRRFHGVDCIFLIKNYAHVCNF